MPFDPQESREAHPKTGRVDLDSKASPAAASSPSHPQDSLSLEHCDLRGPQSAPCERGEGAHQPFLLADADFITLGAAAAFVVAGVLAFLQSKGVLTR